MNCSLFGAPAVWGAKPLLHSITFKCRVLSMLVEIHFKNKPETKTKMSQAPHCSMRCTF